MPERSEWLVAGGVAKRNPRYRDAPPLCEERENRLPRRLLSRLSDAFLYGACIPGVALTLNPRLRALGLRPRHSTFQVGYLGRGSAIINTDYLKFFLQTAAAGVVILAKYGHKKGDPWRCAKGPRLNTIKIDNYIELFHFHVHIGEVLRICIIVANDGIIF